MNVEPRYLNLSTSLKGSPPGGPAWFNSQGMRADISLVSNALICILIVVVNGFKQALHLL